MVKIIAKYIRTLITIFCLFGCQFLVVESKWVEGHLKSTKNWEFLARFCFLSYDGQFEYHIEFNRNVGLPNLLLYYDDESQWPTVYHSNKTCTEREMVLNKAGQNQIIPLSHWYPESEYSGCVLKSADRDEIMRNPPTKAPPKAKKIDKIEPTHETPSIDMNSSTGDPRHFDQFLATSISPDYSTTDSSNTSPHSLELGNRNDSQNSFEVELLEGYTEVPLIEKEENLIDSDLEANLEDVESLFDTETNFQNSSSHKIIKRSPIQQSYDRTKIRKFDPSPPRSRGPLPAESVSRFIVSCHNARRFKSVRERWWFIAISNCGEPKGLDVKYKFLMTNGPPGDYWREHFSADEFYVLPILMAFCCAYIFTIVALVMCSVELKSRQLFHSTYKLFSISVVLQQIGIFLQALAYVKYAVNGIGGSNTKILGQLFCGLSEITYLLLLILMAKGYTITRARLKVGFTVKLTVFICCYFITYISLFIYQAQEFDPGEVLYLYESPAGYGIIVLRICAWLMFIYAIIFTIKKYPEKGLFYYPFSLCGSMWFYAGPMFILAANSLIDKWVRESVVTGVLLFIAFSGHISFLILTLPTFANKNFPYHVRTTQIGVMETAGMIAGNSTVDNFSHHIYNPQNSLAPQTIIIPLTRKTEELLGGMNQYLPSAPMLSALPSPEISKSNRTTISYISSSVPESLNMNDMEPKLSISTQHSTESIAEDKMNPLSDEQRSDSMENRFIPPKDSLTNGNLKSNLEVNGSKVVTGPNSVFYIDTGNGENQNEFVNYSYKNDPNYIKDINNPFLVRASMRRKVLLEPIVKKETYNEPPPKWSLAKNKSSPMKAKSNIFKFENGVVKADPDYRLQGVIASFPLPQYPKKPLKNKLMTDDTESIKMDNKNNTNDYMEDGESSNITQDPTAKQGDSPLYSNTHPQEN